MSRYIAMATWALAREQSDEHEQVRTPSTDRARRSTRPSGAVLRVAIVVLTLATAYIHSTLGGQLFTANAAGYVLLAAAMVVPIPLLSRFRWLVRPALAGYATATIAGWLLMGPRYDLAYVAKGIEVALVGLLLIEMLRYDGGPVAIARRALGGAVRAARVTVGAAGA